MLYNHNLKKNFEKIISFHKMALDKYKYPCRLSLSFLEKSLNEGGVFLPSVLNPEAFFILDNNSSFPFLEYPVVKNLTLLNKINKKTTMAFVNYLKRHGDRFLFIMENYNKQGLDLLSSLNPFETYYCQRKFICYIKDLKLKSTPVFKKIIIRNLDIKKDKLNYVRLYNKTIGFIGGFKDKKFIDDIISSPSFDPQGYFIAESEYEILGFLAIEKEPWWEPRNRFGYIYQIGVVDKYRGSGLSQALFEKAVRFALKKGIDRLGVGVHKNNIAAIKFFTSLGFIPVFEISGYLVDLKFSNKIIQCRISSIKNNFKIL